MRSSRYPSAALATLFVLACQVTSISAAVFNCVGGTVSVIAHADDDLLFQSPDLLGDVQGGGCQTTIIMTAGDSGTTGSTYFSARESGNQAAYAQMAGVSNAYTEFSAVFGGQPITVRTLTGAPNVQKVYFRLPDGNMDGSGFPTTGYQSLRMLYFGSISTITNQPKTATFSLATLRQALGEIITALQPTTIRTLDHMSDYDSGDHADHLTVGRLTAELQAQYAAKASFSGYMGYPVQNFPPTMQTTDASFMAKSNAFFAYAPYDSAECQAYASCVAAGRGESYWLQRQYAVNAYLAQQSYMGSAEAPVALPNGTDIAMLADVTASSEWTTQPASAAVDGNIRGYPGNSSAEWSSYGETVGAWIQLQWDEPYTITSIVLNDRPNLNDWMTGSTITFADNTTIAVGALANDGSATLVSLPGSVVTDSMFLYVTSVSSATSQVGLAEWQVYGTPCKGCSVGSSLNGTTQTTTSSGTTSGSAAEDDLALAGTASASSSFAQQGPEKANDGVINGYKADGSGDPWKEWASYGETTGAYWALQWDSYYMVDSLVLYDRPNADDWITGGVITWSDGSTLDIPALNNDGSATVVNLSEPVNTSSLFFYVTSAGPSSSSVGLAELEAFYSLPQTPISVTQASSSNSTTTLPVQGDLDDETWADDLALADGVVATASSEAPGQGAGNLINENPSGYKEDGSGNAYAEWASWGQGVGAWARLEFPYSIVVKEISLYDRPNLNDQVTSGRLSFDDGSFITVGELDNAGAATNFSVPNIVTTSILFTVSGVSASTSSVGLSEWAVYGSVAQNVSSTVADNSTTSSLSNVTVVNGTAIALINSTTTAVNSTEVLSNSTFLNATGLSNSTLLNGTAAYNASVVNGTSSLNSTLPGSLYNASSPLYNASSPLYNVTVPGYNGTLANSTSLANWTAPLHNGSIPSNSSLVNGTSSLSGGTASGASSFLSGLFGSATQNASSALPSSTSYNISSSAVQTGYNVSASASASASATGQNVSASGFSTLSGYSLSSSALPTASASNLSSSASASATSVNFTTSEPIPSASASALLSSSRSSLFSSSIFNSSSNGFATMTRSAAASAASTASSVLSAASSFLSSAPSSAASSAASVSSSALLSSTGMVTSTRPSSAASTATPSSSHVVMSSSAVSSSSTASSSAVSTAATGLPTAAAQAATVNIARIPGVKVSSSSSSSKSPASGINDGNFGGVSALGFGSPSQEWVSGGTTGQWVQIDLPENHLIRDLIVANRINTWNSVTSGVLNFTDGTVIKVSSPSTSGSHVSLGDGIVTSGVRFTITGVSLTTTAAGLSEIQLYNRPAPSYGLVGTLGNAVGQTVGGVLGLLGL
ncbi:hypothetical protein JCM10213_005013 [Rhodosporidiobolus nylandii]